MDELTEELEIERELEAARIAEIRRTVDRSFEQDPERAKLSYTEHTATAIRRRVLAQSNGHSKDGFKPGSW